MFSWLADNATTLYWLLAVVAAGFAAAWYMTRRVKYLGIAAAIGGVAALLFLLTRFVVSDRQQIENNLHAMAAAVVARDAEKFVEYLAKDFVFAGKSRDEVKAYAVQAAKGHGVDDVHVWDIDVRNVDRGKKKASVEFRLRANARDGTFAAFCVSTFHLEE